MITSIVQHLVLRGKKACLPSQIIAGSTPAISCPFTPEQRIDEPALRKLAAWLASHEGVVAIMTNGHTGEVFLTPAERAEVTRIVADELKGRCPVISSIDFPKAWPRPPSTHVPPWMLVPWRWT